jgi:hypothetical protein
MTDRKDKRTGGIQRYPIASHRTSSLQIIPFDKLVRSEHIVKISDLSVVGMGIESQEPLEPGLACFEERVVGHKFGVVSWCRPSGEGFRAGISFMTLPREKERYILDQVKQSPDHKSLRDPEKIIETLLKSIKRDSNG